MIETDAVLPLPRQQRLRGRRRHGRRPRPLRRLQHRRELARVPHRRVRRAVGALASAGQADRRASSRTSSAPWRGEFPQHDWRRSTMGHRYAYMAGGESSIVQAGSSRSITRPRAGRARVRRGAGRGRADLRPAVARLGRGRRLAPERRLLRCRAPLAARRARRARRGVRAGRGGTSAPPRAARLPRNLDGPRGEAERRRRPSRCNAGVKRLSAAAFVSAPSSLITSPFSIWFSTM